ncbi:MAG TPA: TonB-dependent receptor [Vicinamibacterales bacterium]|nr:TonB-dependent receptor [Vicinamibacterales bacterium]
MREYSLFAQDEWRPSSDVTLNVGLRYDLMTIAAPPVRHPDQQLAAAGIDTSRLDPDVDNWGPRLGVAWSPASRPYVVRGGWGLSYGRTPAIMPTTAHSQNGINVVSLTFTGAAVPTYNLFNRANINGVEQTYYSVSLPTLTLTPNASFGRPQSSAGERIMQLAAKITF